MSIRYDLEKSCLHHICRNSSGRIVRESEGYRVVDESMAEREVNVVFGVSDV